MASQIYISEETTLLDIEESHAAELYELTDTNRTYLREWLPWLDYVSKESDTLEFIKKSISQREDSKGPIFVISHKNKLGGVVGFNSIDNSNRTGEIGYWLSEALQGKAIITSSCKALIKLGFEDYNLNRIQIAAAEHNTKSRSIPERLGFKYEGLLRNRECLYGTYVSHAMYSILKDEYTSLND